LVLKENRYYVESAYPDVLQVLLKDREIQQVIIHHDAEEATAATFNEKSKEQQSAENGLIQSKAPSKKDIQISGIDNKNIKDKESAEAQTESKATDDSEQQETDAARTVPDDIYDAMINLDKDDMDDDDDRVYSFEISSSKVEFVRRRCNQIDHPLIEEYDFHNDKTLPNLEIDLKPTTIIRPYQEKSLSKMFGNGRARSGIIVLPCGAGKTLVGITAACTVKKSCLVLCTSAVSVEQWKAQFKMWSNATDRNIARFTSECKEQVCYFG
jgi:DNA excision repair protein ERCC-3